MSYAIPLVYKTHINFLQQTAIAVNVICDVLRRCGRCHHGTEVRMGMWFYYLGHPVLATVLPAIPLHQGRTILICHILISLCIKGARNTIHNYILRLDALSRHHPVFVWMEFACPFRPTEAAQEKLQPQLAIPHRRPPRRCRDRPHYDRSGN